MQKCHVSHPMQRPVPPLPAYRKKQPSFCSPPASLPLAHTESHHPHPPHFSASRFPFSLFFFFESPLFCSQEPHRNVKEVSDSIHGKTWTVSKGMGLFDFRHQQPKHNFQPPQHPSQILRWDMYIYIFSFQGMSFSSFPPVCVCVLIPCQTPISPFTLLCPPRKTSQSLKLPPSFSKRFLFFDCLPSRVCISTSFLLACPHTLSHTFSLVPLPPAPFACSPCS